MFHVKRNDHYILKDMAKHNTVGALGESIAASFLMKQGFSIIEKNYRVRQGEIDIVALKDDKLHFVEVKSVQVKDCSLINNLTIQPEDNFTYAKWRKFLQAVNLYRLNKNVPHETQYQIDLACVYIDTIKRLSRVKLIQSVTKD